jgi:hypothetical protein
LKDAIETALIPLGNFRAVLEGMESMAMDADGGNLSPQFLFAGLSGMCQLLEKDLTERLDFLITQVEEKIGGTIVLKTAMENKPSHWDKVLDAKIQIDK